MSGKGSGRRPAEVDDATFQSNWDRIFGGSSPAVESTQSVAGSDSESAECPICQIRKLVEDFPTRNGKYRFSYCKACFRRKYNDPYYAKNKDRYRENAKRFLEPIQEWVMRYLIEHPCVDCGNRDLVVLDFDHVRGTKSFGISQGVKRGYSIDRLKSEIDKCEIRCANCHRRVTAQRAGWKKLSWGVA